MSTSGNREPETSNLSASDEGLIVDLLKTEGKIAAIKEYRLRTGSHLKDSKEAVEAIARRHGVEVKSGSPAGCIVAVLVGLLAAGMAYFLLTGQ